MQNLGAIYVCIRALESQNMLQIIAAKRLGILLACIMCHSSNSSNISSCSALHEQVAFHIADSWRDNNK